MSTPWADLRAALPGLRGTCVHVLPAADEPALRAALAEQSFEVRTVEGAPDRESLFAEMERALGWTSFGRNLDALHDAMGEFLADRSRLALVFRDAGRLLAGDPQAALDVVLVLVAEAEAAADVDAPHGPAQVEVFLLDASFPPRRADDGR